MNDIASESWWLATLGRTIVWARLREREAGFVVLRRPQPSKR